MESYPRLRALFGERLAILDGIAGEDRDGFVRGQAERLLTDAEGRAIAGLAKLAEDGNSCSKLRNLLAELRFAILFSKLGARVTLLRDGEFGSDDIYTPDLHVAFDGGLEILVEVFRLSSGDPDVISHIQKQTDASRLLCRISYVIGERLSVPPVAGKARTESISLAKDVAEQCVQGMVEASQAGHQFGTVHVFRDGGALRSELEIGKCERLPHAEEMSSRVGEWMASFEFEPSPLEYGYVSGGVTSAHILDDEAQRARFARDLESKAWKRVRLPPPHHATPFVVAVQNDDFELTPLNALSAITGSRCHSTDPPALRAAWLREGRAKYPSAATTALHGPWGSVLEAWGYGPDAPDLLTSFGAYLNEQWAKNLSGVLITHHSRTRVQWLPNPFAAPEIADPSILAIALSLEMLGSDAP